MTRDRDDPLLDIDDREDREERKEERLDETEERDDMLLRAELREERMELRDDKRDDTALETLRRDELAPDRLLAELKQSGVMRQ